MRKVEKPWGYEEIWAETEKYVGKILTILPGHRLSLQYHNVKEETIYVMEGELLVWTSENESDHFHVQKGETYHVNPKQVHRFGASKGYQLTRLIEVSTPEIDDVVRLKDDYRR